MKEVSVILWTLKLLRLLRKVEYPLKSVHRHVGLILPECIYCT